MFDMLTEVGRNPALAQILQNHSRVMQRLLAGVLRNGQAQGRIDPSLDAEMAASVLIGVVDGSKAMTVRDPLLDRVGMIKLLRTLVARFLAPSTSNAVANRYPTPK